MRRNTAEDFHRRYRKGKGCWEWEGTPALRGYGQFSWNGTTIRAHRLAYILAYGPVPKGIHVCHHCDNRNCVRPDHLYIGTAADNNRDMRERGRQAHGEGHGSSKLKNEDVRHIRKLYGRYNMSQRRLARLFNVSQFSIGKIVRNERWTHV